MARLVMLTTLIADVRQLGDWEGQDATTGRVTDAFIKRALNQAITQTWLEIARVSEQHKVNTTVAANTAAGQSAYALAADFLWGLAVLVTIDGVERELTRIDMLDATNYSDSSGNTGTPCFFQFVGDNLEFVPTPDGVYSFRYRYVGVPTDLSGGSDPFDGIVGFEQHSVALAVETIATREKEWDLANAMATRAARFRESIYDTLKRRNPFPPTVTDVRGLSRRNQQARRWR